MEPPNWHGNSAVDSLPMPLSSPAAAIIDGKLYAAGGSVTGRGAQAKMWVADVP